MRAFFALVKKDLILFLNEPRSLIMAFVAPILIGSFFGYVFGNNNRPSEEKNRLRLLFVNQDSSEVSIRLLAKLKEDENLETVPATLAEATESVRKGAAPVALVIPAGFGEQASASLFRGNKKPELRLLHDPSKAMEAGMVRGLLVGQVMQVVTQSTFSSANAASSTDSALRDLESSDMPEGQKSALRTVLGGLKNYGALRSQEAGQPAAPMASGGLSIPFTTKEEAVTSGRGVSYNSYAHSFGGMALQFMLFAAIDVGTGLLLLRRRGLWRRFRAAPLSKLLLLGSRAASATLVGLVILVVVFVFARFAFQVRIEGSMLGFLLTCASFSLLAATYGLLIAALGKTPEAARGLATLVTMLLVMTSGAWVPSFIFPKWMNTLTLANPVRWAMDALDGMTWRGLDLGAALPSILVLLATSLVFGAIAVWRFRFDEQ